MESADWLEEAIEAERVAHDKKTAMLLTGIAALGLIAATGYLWWLLQIY
jgi:hypothetical protein